MAKKKSGAAKKKAKATKKATAESPKSQDGDVPSLAEESKQVGADSATFVKVDDLTTPADGEKAKGSEQAAVSGSSVKDNQAGTAEAEEAKPEAKTTDQESQVDDATGTGQVPEKAKTEYGSESATFVKVDGGVAAEGASEDVPKEVGETPATETGEASTPTNSTTTETTSNANPVSTAVPLTTATKETAQTNSIATGDQPPKDIGADSATFVKVGQAEESDGFKLEKSKEESKAITEKAEDEKACVQSNESESPKENADLKSEKEQKDAPAGNENVEKPIETDEETIDRKADVDDDAKTSKPFGSDSATFVKVEMPATSTLPAKPEGSSDGGSGKAEIAGAKKSNETSSPSYAEVAKSKPTSIDTSATANSDTKPAITPGSTRRIVKAQVPQVPAPLKTSSENGGPTPSGSSNSLPLLADDAVERDDDEKDNNEDYKQEEDAAMRHRKTIRKHQMEKHKQKWNKTLEQRRMEPSNGTGKPKESPSPNPFSRFLSYLSVEPEFPEHKRSYEGDSEVVGPVEKKQKSSDDGNDDENDDDESDVKQTTSRSLSLPGKKPGQFTTASDFASTWGAPLLAAAALVAVAFVLRPKKK